MNSQNQPRKPSIGRMSARTQSRSSAPAMQFVTVGVLPPRLPPGMAPPTGLGMADAFGWDESINWKHNLPIAQAEAEAEAQTERQRRRSSLFLNKRTLSTSRTTKRNPDSPPFVLRQIPYDTWRKHYAKDKDGNYKGTHAPAQDCLLLPHDVERWRLGEPTTFADRFTRGTEALPVYGEEEEQQHHETTPGLPEYVPDRDEDLETQRRRRREQEGALEALKRQNEEAMRVNRAKKDGWRKKLQRGLEMGSMVG